MSTDQNNWGLRADGSQKGRGFLGVLQRPDGNVSSELSMGTTDVNGSETDIPLLVPTLSRDEVQYLLSAPQGDWQNPTMKRIAAKAVDFARTRLKQGKPFFAQAGEQQTHIYPQFPREPEAPGFNDATFRPMASHTTDPMIEAIRILSGLKK